MGSKETLQQKIDSNYKQWSYGDIETFEMHKLDNKAIQELRDDIKNYSEPVELKEPRNYVSYDRTLIPVKVVLAMIGEKK